jgi:hypothetical protein
MGEGGLEQDQNVGDVESRQPRDEIRIADVGEVAIRSCHTLPDAPIQGRPRLAARRASF